MDETRRLIVDQIPHLRRYARALLGDPDAADDLVQDSLTRAMDRLHLWRPETNMRAWLSSILHNQHVNAVRRRARRPDRVDLEPAHDGLHAAPPEQDAGPGLRDLGRALAQLSEDQRQWAADGGFGGHMQDDRAVGRTAHASVGDPDHVGDPFLEDFWR